MEAMTPPTSPRPAFKAPTVILTLATIASHQHDRECERIDELLALEAELGVPPMHGGALAA